MPKNKTAEIIEKIESIDWLTEPNIVSQEQKCVCPGMPTRVRDRKAGITYCNSCGLPIQEQKCRCDGPYTCKVHGGEFLFCSNPACECHAPQEQKIEITENPETGEIKANGVTVVAPQEQKPDDVRLEKEVIGALQEQKPVSWRGVEKELEYVATYASPKRREELLRLLKDQFQTLLEAEIAKAKSEVWRDVADTLFNNPYDQWDEKVGKTREREKQRWNGWDEAREKVLSSAKETDWPQNYKEPNVPGV